MINRKCPIACPLQDDSDCENCPVQEPIVIERSEGHCLECDEFAELYEDEKCVHCTEEK